MAKKLKAPKGTDEANIAGHSYRVDNNQTITLPDDADAGPLLERGGFTEVLPVSVFPEGQVLVFHDDPEASCSCVIEKSDGGLVVPASMVADLVDSHGFRTSADAPAPDAPAVIADEAKLDEPVVVAAPPVAEVVTETVADPAIEPTA